jgi:AraC-like DNA-binding protein
MGPEAAGLLRTLSIGARGAQGPDLFRQEMARLFGVGLAVTASGGFETQVKAYCGARLRFAELRFSPHTTSSSQAGSGASRLLVSLQKQGVAVVQQGGRESRIEPGDMFLIDPARPFTIETGEILTHSVYLEPEGVRSVVPELESLTAVSFRATEGAAALFRSLVDEMFALADVLDETAADRLADALPHVLAAALAHFKRSEVLPTRMRAMHKQRILQFVRENLRNHALDASLVAASVRLSTRYVYEVFEDEGQPLMKWIWGLRLERCRNDLGSPILAARSIGEIAFYWGFNDVAHFSRAFRQRFGEAPRDYRSRQAALRVAAGTASQAA